MLKQVVTYTDHDGVQKTETLRFHVTKAEVVKAFTLNGDLMDRWSSAIRSDNKLAFIEMFDDMIKLSVGIVDPATNQFSKPKGHAEQFFTTEAYSELFMTLMGDPQKAIKFFMSLFPLDMIEAAKAQVLKDPQGTAAQLGVDEEALKASVEVYTTVAPKVEEIKPSIAMKPLEEYTSSELFDMPREQFDLLVGKDPQKMKHEHMVVAMQRFGAGR